MHTNQWLAVGLIAVMMIAFVWGRLRNDVVAVGALVAGLCLGVVEAERAFSSFGPPLSIIVVLVSMPTPLIVWPI